MSLALEPLPAAVLLSTDTAAPRRHYPPWQRLVAILLVGLAVVIVCAEIAYLVAKQQDEVWAARSEIEYRGDSWVESQAIAVGSRSLWESTAVAEGIPLDDFAEDFKPQLLAGTQVLRLQYEDVDAARAQRIVDQLTARYLDEYSQPPTPELDVQAQWEARLLEIDRQIFAVEVELGTIEVRPNDVVPPRLTVLQSKLQTLAVDRAAAENQISQLELEAERKALEQPKVITDTFLLDEPVAPAPLRRAVLGALAGAVLAGVLGFVALRRYLFR